MANDKLQSLKTYAADLKQKLNGPVPTRHASSPARTAAWKQMLQIDLKKTEEKIARLSA